MSIWQKLLLAFWWACAWFAAVFAVLCAIYGLWLLALINACSAITIGLNAFSYRESVLAIAESKAHLDRLRGGQ